MLWLLPREAGPVHVRLDPGMYVVPQWYDEVELGVLVELLRRILEPAVVHAVVLPIEAVRSGAWARVAPGGPVIVAVRGAVDEEQRLALGSWAREHRHHVLVAARAEDGELATGWLERSIKPAVVWLLERGVWVDEHPLAAFGIESLSPDEVARVTEDPVEMVWLLERMLRHRLQYAEQGLGERDYARSLGHAVGERCAERLRRQGEGLTAALDVIVGGPQGQDGWAALVGAGLGVWRERVFQRGPLLRVVEGDWAVVEVILGELGEGELSAEGKEVVRERRRPAEGQAHAQVTSVQVSEAGSSSDGELLAAALRAGLGELEDAPKLLGEVVEAIERWGPMHWNEERIEVLRDLRLRLRGVVDAPSATHRRFARIEGHVLAILTSTRPDELAVAREAREALRDVLGEPLDGWVLDVWLHATLECCKRHLDRAASIDDLVHAETLLRDVVTIGEERDRPWHVADARWHLAVIAMRRGELDAALHSLREEVLPAFERLGDVRNKAGTMGQIADILRVRGDLDGALHIREHDQLPVYERLGDVHSKAITMGRIADILQAQGNLDSALHIRQHDQLPAYERLGDARGKAVTMGKIADILQAQGNLDDALHIRQHDQLPVYERLGDVREKAVTMGKIANILRARGDLDGALHIHQYDQLPVYERLGDVRENAATLTWIAVLRLQQDDATARTDATRLLSEAYRAFTRMRLPEARSILQLAARHGLELDADALAAIPDAPPE